jgi:EmrB/QacA subfamily drug resistance transporter
MEAQTTTAQPESDRIDPHVWRISSVVIIGSIMSILDMTIVNVALATLAHDLNAGISQIQWVVTGYTLALASVIPVAGWAAKRFTPKNVYVLSLILFTLGSAACGLAQTSTQLIIFRVFQGIGGGLILPVGQLMMAQAAGPKRMGRVMSLVAVPAMLAPIFGPTLGGLIIQGASWRWIFEINVPIGVIAVVSALRVLPRAEAQRGERLDSLGLALMASGLLLLTYGLAEIGTLDTFSSPRVLGPGLAGIVLIAAFVLHALRVRNPLLDLHLYRRPTFASASMAMFCLGAALFGAMVLLPLYLQEVRHYTVVDTGLLTASQGIGMACVMPIAGKLADRFGGGPIALFGVVLTTLASLPFALITAHTPVPEIVAAMFVRGLGIGFAFLPAMTAAYASLERSELPDATPQMNILQRVGGSIGVAVLAVVLERSLVGAHTTEQAAAAFGTAFWWAAALTALAIIPCVILMRAERAARTAHAQQALDGAALAEVTA